MAVNLKGRSFLTLADFTPAEIRYLLDLARDLKAKRRSGVCEPTMQGKHIVLLFEKTSTRTRCSFEVAATQEGAHVTYLDAGSSQMGKKESLEDSAKVLGRFFDGIEYRGFDQKAVSYTHLVLRPPAAFVSISFFAPIIPMRRVGSTTSVIGYPS